MPPRLSLGSFFYYSPPPPSHNETPGGFFNSRVRPKMVRNAHSEKGDFFPQVHGINDLTPPKTSEDRKHWPIPSSFSPWSKSHFPRTPSTWLRRSPNFFGWSGCRQTPNPPHLLIFSIFRQNPLTLTTLTWCVQLYSRHNRKGVEFLGPRSH